MILPFLKLAASYGAVIAGADVATRILGKVAPAPIAPVISGVADTAMAVIDPFHLTGERASIVDTLAGPQGGLGAIFSRLRGDSSELRVERAMSQAEASAASYVRESQAAQQRGDKARAGEAATKALHSDRWAKLARMTADEASKPYAPPVKSTLQNRALKLASLAANPPHSPAVAIAGAESPSEKSLIVSFFDAVNRPMAEPDYPALVARIAERNGDIDPSLAGACCSSCAKSGGSCGGTMPAPRGLVDGSAFGGDFDSMFGAEGAIKGPDEDWLGDDVDEEDIFAS